MTSHLADLAARREALVERSRAQLDELRSHADQIEREIGWVATLGRAARALRRSGPVIALVAGIVMIAGPTRVLRTLGTAVRYVPIAPWAREAAPQLYWLFYRSPAPFDPYTTHDYLVTPVDAAIPEAEQERRLRAWNRSAITLNHVVHHGALGHHVQNWHATHRSASRIGTIAGVDGAGRIATTRPPACSTSPRATAAGTSSSRTTPGTARTSCRRPSTSLAWTSRPTRATSTTASASPRSPKRAATTPDDGSNLRMQQGSLRQFILNSNAITGVQTSRFALSTSDPNYVLATTSWTISIPTGAPLPTISDAAVIDGWSAPGFVANPLIEIRPTVASAEMDGLTITAGNSTVRGLVINRWRGRWGLVGRPRPLGRTGVAVGVVTFDREE